MEDREGLRRTLMDVLGEEGCGLACDEAEIYRDAEGWKLNLCGFLEPWELGSTSAEAGARLRELAAMHFGISHGVA